MALWMVRAGKHGEHEQCFLDGNRVCACWNGLKYDLALADQRSDLETVLREHHPQASAGRIANHARQLWAFRSTMSPDDWVIVPSKLKPAIHIAKIVGDYEYDEQALSPLFHTRKVQWIQQDIPRSNFDQDILYSLGALMSICRIRRHDAERRIRAMASSGWIAKSPARLLQTSNGDDGDEVFRSADLEQVARDQLAKLLLARFKGHGMARLVGAILSAEGYTIHESPAGPDQGVDLLAAPGSMGFGSPRICVQVKSGDYPLDRPTLDQLIGTMQNVQAEHGLLVSWGGFKSSIDREKVRQFFRVRLWDQNDLIDQLLEHYENLDDGIRAELPLKRIWTVVTPDDDE